MEGWPAQTLFSPGNEAFGRFGGGAEHCPPGAALQTHRELHRAPFVNTVLS